MQLARPLFALLVVLSAVSSGLAQNVRSAVSTSGTDAATCTVPDPCRTFTAAMARTNPGGEVIALGSGGYGPFTITQSVSVISPLAFHAAIAPTSGAAITVNAPGATVVIRGMYLNSQGATEGVAEGSVGILHIENLVVNGFSGNGIAIFEGAEVFVKDSQIRNGGVGILASPDTTTLLNVDNVRMERNLYGLVADAGLRVNVRNSAAVRNELQNFWFRNGNGGEGTLVATIENTLASDSAGEFGGGGGFAVHLGSRVTIRNSASVRNMEGFQVFTGTLKTEMVLDQCLATENTRGALAYGSEAILMVSNSTLARNVQAGLGSYSGATVRAFGNSVTRNGTGFEAGPGSTFQSLGHNAVVGNTAFETSGTITPVPTM